MTEATALADAEPRTLRRLGDELAWLALALRAGERPRDPAGLRRRIDAALADYESRALAAGHAREAVEDARFALAALVDEALSEIDEAEAGTGAAVIDRRLAAADDFFERLERLRSGDDHDGQVLEVFQLCLSLGYRGRYRFEGGEKLRYLASSLAQELARMHGDRAVFTRGAVPPESRPTEPPSATPPVVSMGRLALAGLALCVAAWGVYRFLVEQRVDAVLDAARRILPSQ